MGDPTRLAYCNQFFNENVKNQAEARQTQKSAVNYTKHKENKENMILTNNL